MKTDIVQYKIHFEVCNFMSINLHIFSMKNQLRNIECIKELQTEQNNYI